MVPQIPLGIATSSLGTTALNLNTNTSVPIHTFFKCFNKLFGKSCILGGAMKMSLAHIILLPRLFLAAPVFQSRSALPLDPGNITDTNISASS